MIDFSLWLVLFTKGASVDKKRAGLPSPNPFFSYKFFYKKYKIFCIYQKILYIRLMFNKTNNKMKNYLNKLIDEKGLDKEIIIEVEGDSGTNFIPLGVVVEHIIKMPNFIKRKIKLTLIKVDFLNGDVMDYFTYLAKGIAK